MTYRDEFDEPPRSGFISRVGPKAAFFVVLIALSFLIGMVWKLYVGGGDKGVNVPIVRADTDNFKVTPDDPGGMEIPHKDSTIFSSLKAERAENENKIENLLADDNNEEPMPRSQLFAGLNTDQNTDIGKDTDPSPLDQPLSQKAQEIEEAVQNETTNVASFIESTVAPVVEPVPEITVPKKVEPVIEAKPEPKVEAAPAPKPAIKATPKPKPVATPTSTPVSNSTAAVVPKTAPASGDYFIQLGSVKTKLGAETEWKKIVAKYPTQLSGYPHRVETANLGDKGTFYRIQAGPVSKAKADSVCGEIKKITPGACLVKKK